MRKRQGRKTEKQGKKPGRCGALLSKRYQTMSK
jgi:hypothetical protein